MRAHVFLCILAYYVEGDMPQALAPLFHDQELNVDRTRRDPVAPAQLSESVRRKKHTAVAGALIREQHTVAQSVAASLAPATSA